MLSAEKEVSPDGMTLLGEFTSAKVVKDPEILIGRRSNHEDPGQEGSGQAWGLG